MTIRRPQTGLSFKIITSVFLSISIVFLIIFLYNYNVTSSIIEKKVEDTAENLTQKKINQVETILVSVEKVPQNIANLIEKFSYSEDQLIEILNIMVGENDAIYGATIAFEPYMFDKGKKYLAPYVYKSSGSLEISSLATEAYNYPSADWYKVPKSLGKAVWSEPYYDEGGGNALMSTFSVPIFKRVNGERKIIGIITSDISLEWLDEIVATNKELESSYGFLVSKEGRLITFPDSKMIMRSTIFDLAKSLKSPQLEQVAENMIKGRNGFTKYNYVDKTDDKVNCIYYAPIPLNGWSIAVTYPDKLTDELDSLIKKLTALSIIGLFLLLVVIMIVSKSITKPLTRLSAATDHFAKGEMDYPLLKIKSNDEIGKLANSFNVMVENIRSSMKEIKEKSTLAEKAAQEAEREKRISSEKEEYLQNNAKEMLEKMERLSEGDLSVRLNYEDKDELITKLFKGFNNVVSNLRNVILKVTEAVQATASAANQISSSTEEMAAGAQEQSSQATEVAGAVEEMTKTIYETTKNTNQASDAAKNSGKVAREGGKVVEETIAGMNKIAEVVRESAETVQQLGKNSDQIGEIVQVIDDIADQTNLLALNAAIEAARAGEQGRGFAVVADEVRKLAERTTKATKEIATMIKQIQKDTNGAVESMQQGTQEVESGKTLAEKAGASLKDIINGAEQVVDIVSQVAAASEEQSSAAEQISKNIESISSVTQQSASGLQQIAHASEDLNRLTLNLQELIAQFKVDNSTSHFAVRQNGKLVHS
ncbi:MAG: HAMP domain-containing protein [Ignavibacteriota bacterium]|nr:HAMP domain-containing protein [Ignavibacteriota bacterium]QKK00268.1 MAG: HAMP domain-containing protein [Ignavibacteriota bacterium]HOJ08440.1 methyl-accepting chemotaxis protein [Ignavibacteriaceae bacterium]